LRRLSATASAGGFLSEMTAPSWRKCCATARAIQRTLSGGSNNFDEHTRKREFCHGKRSDAQQSRSQETEAGQKADAHHPAVRLAAHSGSARFVVDNEEALSLS
jgi:hypothetical protein